MVNKQTINSESLALEVMKENHIKDIALQKYYSHKWFLNALRNNCYTFQEPSSWDDPFEDFISKLTNNSKKAYVNNIDITKNIYALSTISKKQECDGMWRNFAKSSGVLIHTSLKKIIISIIDYLINKNALNNNDKYLNYNDIKTQIKDSIRVQKINYTTEEKIANLFRYATNQENDDYYKLAIDMLSVKRNEYEYENEYRVFIKAELLGLELSKFLKIGYFKSSIERIILSPIINKTREERLKKLLSRKYNIDNKIIDKSKLYNIEDFRKRYNL